VTKSASHVHIFHVGNSIWHLILSAANKPIGISVASVHAVAGTAECSTTFTRGRQCAIETKTLLLGLFHISLRLTHQLNQLVDRSLFHPTQLNCAKLLNWLTANDTLQNNGLKDFKLPFYMGFQVPRTTGNGNAQWSVAVISCEGSDYQSLVVCRLRLQSIWNDIRHSVRGVNRKLCQSCQHHATINHCIISHCQYSQRTMWVLSLSLTLSTVSTQSGQCEYSQCPLWVLTVSTVSTHSQCPLWVLTADNVSTLIVTHIVHCEYSEWTMWVLTVDTVSIHVHVTPISPSHTATSLTHIH